MIVSICFIAVGFVVWKKRTLAHRRRALDNDRARAYEEFVDVLLVALHTGLSLSETLGVAATCLTGSSAHEISHLHARITKGEPLTDVLPALADVFGYRAFSLVDIIRGSLTDGMPVVHVVERLGDEARAERRRRMDAELRRLPIRLVFPLTICVLPSFVLLTVVPIGIRAISTFNQGGTP